MNKICNKCKQEKPESKFGMNGKYRRNVCYDCRNSKHLSTKNKDIKIKEYNPRYTFDMNSVQNKIKIEPKPLRCAYELCKCIIPLPDRRQQTVFANTSLSHRRGKEVIYYCNSWCKEMAELDRIKIRKCKKCDNSVSPIYNKKTGCIANWRVICDECSGRNKSDMSIKNI